jgi:hypothetical protein
MLEPPHYRQGPRTGNDVAASKTQTAPIPTIAGAQNIKTILEGLNQVDPQRLSNVFPRFYDEVEKIKNVLNAKGNPGDSSGAAGNDKGGQMLLQEH